MSWQLTWRLAIYIYITMLHTRKTVAWNQIELPNSIYKQKNHLTCLSIRKVYKQSATAKKSKENIFVFAVKTFQNTFCAYGIPEKIIYLQSLSFTVWCAFVCHLGPHIGHTLGRLLRRRNYVKSWKQVCSFFIKSNCVIFVAPKVSPIGFFTQT